MEYDKVSKINPVYRMYNKKLFHVKAKNQQAKPIQPSA